MFHVFINRMFKLMEAVGEGVVAGDRKVSGLVFVNRERFYRNICYTRGIAEADQRSDEVCSKAN